MDDNEKLKLWEEFTSLTGWPCDWPTSEGDWDHLQRSVKRLRRMKEAYDQKSREDPGWDYAQTIKEDQQ